MDDSVTVSCSRRVLEVIGDGWSEPVQFKIERRDDDDGYEFWFRYVDTKADILMKVGRDG